MPSTSTSTRLEVVNRVLLNVAERQVTTTVGNELSTAAQRAVESVRTSFQELSLMYDWSWNFAAKTADSFLLETATVNNMHRLHDVVYKRIVGVQDYRKLLTPVSHSVFQSMPIIQMQDNQVPEYYCLWTDNEIKFNPYPQASQYNNFLFLITETKVLPVADIGVFSCPERFLVPLVFRASYYMAVNHVHDAQLATQFETWYYNWITRSAGRERGIPTGKLSMFQNKLL